MLALDCEREALSRLFPFDREASPAGVRSDIVVCQRKLGIRSKDRVWRLVLMSQTGSVFVLSSRSADAALT